MPRLALLNCAIGFLLLSIAACAGVFLSFYSTSAFLLDKSLLETWLYQLARSAHTHTSQFGVLHITFGLTLVFSPLTARFKIIQTILLGSGSIAMSALLLLRAYGGPTSSFDSLGLLIGAGVSGAIVTLLSHCFALVYKVLR